MCGIVPRIVFDTKTRDLTKESPKCDGEGSLGMGHEERSHHDRHGFCSGVPQGSIEIRERESDLALEGSSAAPIRLIDPR